jgi:hypothetical protein
VHDRHAVRRRRRSAEPAVSPGHGRRPGRAAVQRLDRESRRPAWSSVSGPAAL